MPLLSRTLHASESDREDISHYISSYLFQKSKHYESNLRYSNCHRNRESRWHLSQTPTLRRNSHRLSHVPTLSQPRRRLSVHPPRLTQSGFQTPSSKSQLSTNSVPVLIPTSFDPITSSHHSSADSRSISTQRIHGDSPRQHEAILNTEMTTEEKARGNGTAKVSETNELCKEVEQVGSGTGTFGGC